MRSTRKTHREWTERFSDFLDGDLSTDERLGLEGHLAGCAPCRDALEDLREVVAAARDLQDLEPPRDLWGGIAAAIGAPTVGEPDPKVIALPRSGVERPATVEVSEYATTPARLSFSRGQLLAASIALVAVSSTVTWMAGPGLGVRSEPAAEIAAEPDGAPVAMASARPAPPEGLADELAALETALAEAESVLDPNTVRVLERNLGVIEQAIEDSGRALAQDPGNEFLSAHLERVYERKLAYLREATRLAEWSG